MNNLREIHEEENALHACSSNLNLGTSHGARNYVHESYTIQGTIFLRS